MGLYIVVTDVDIKFFFNIVGIIFIRSERLTKLANEKEKGINKFLLR